MPGFEKPTKARAFRGVPPEVRKQERREKLLEAGLNQFGSRGYHNVTVRDVCGDAKLTERYFYESFENLEELFLAVYAALHEQLKRETFASITEVINRGPVREPLLLAETSVTAWYRFIRDDPRRYRILLMDTMNVNARLSRQAGSANREYVAMTRQLLLILFPDGERAFGLDGYLIAQGIIGINLSMARSWARDQFKAPLEDVVRNTMAFYRGLSAFEREARAHAKAENEAKAELPPTGTDPAKR